MFARFIFYKILGWRLDETRLPSNIKKAVFVVAPHTSNMDFIIGWLAFKILKVPVKFLIKKEWFRFPIGGLMKLMGGLPVDRSIKNNSVQEIAQLFNNSKELFVVITPEGTRSLVTKWKRGFYYISLQAKVPMVITYMDYKNKRGGLGMIMTPSGNFDDDFAIIENFYRGKHAKNPEKFNLSPPE